MKTELFQQHIDNNLFVGCPTLNKDKSNIRDFYSADVVGNRRFAQNYGGYPRSDIAEINEQASLQQAQSLLRDLQVFEPTNENAGLNDAEIMLGHKSKYLQSASEMVPWLEQQIAIRDAKRNPKPSSDNENLIQFDNDSNPESE